MSENEYIKAGMAQMDYELVDNGVLELPVATPATYEFQKPATYNPDVFESEIESYDFGLVGINTKQKDDGEFYYYADVVTDHYKRVAVKIWQEQANLFPKEELPDTHEVSRIVHAIEDAFEAELEHSQDNE